MRAFGAALVEPSPSPDSLEQIRVACACAGGNTKSFYQTDDAYRTMLMTDWEVARLHHSLVTFITRTQLTIEEFLKRPRLPIDNIEAPEVCHCHPRQHHVLSSLR